MVQRAQTKIIKSIFVVLLGVLLTTSLFFYKVWFSAVSVWADSLTWNFSTTTDYTYNSAKISVVNGGAYLASPSGWYDSKWLYRKAITIDNTALGTVLSNYQIDVDLDSSNFDFSKAMANGEDIRITDADGVTVIPYYLEHFNNLNMITQGVENYAVVSGAAAWWQLSANANDSGENANNGTLAGNAAFLGSSLKLDGNGDYVSVADSASLDFNSSFTIELWARPDTLPASETTRQFIAKGGTGDGTGNDHNYYFGMGNADTGYGLTKGPGVVFGFEDSAGNNYQVVEYIQLNTGQWYHLTGVFDDTANTLSIYINGTLLKTLSSVTATPFTQNSSLLIGAKLTSAEFFDGRIREVRMFNSAISASQILADYQTTSQKAKIWVKVPSIPASSTKTIYLYYGLNSTTNLKAGLISDVHGFSDNGDKKGVQATDYLTDYINRMNNSFVPDVSVDLGDKITTVDQATDITDLTTVSGIFGNLTSPHYYTLGNHEVANLTKTQVKTALGIDYTRKSVDVGNYHIIVLDSQDTEQADPWGGALTEADKTWLTTELAATSKKTLVFSHQPLDTQNMALNQYFATSDDVFLANAADVRAILENDGDVIGVFSGHLHWINKSIINDIPYFSLGSLVEDYGKNWVEASIVGNQFLNIVFKQNGETERLMIWDFVNHIELNKPSTAFDFYDSFEGDSGQWAELTGLTGGNWSISGKGYLQETGTATGQHKILNSSYSEPANYIIEANIGLYGTTVGRTQLGGFASRITNSTNFDAIYMANDADDDIRWKQMDNTTWELIGQQATFTPDTYWHQLKMVKLGNQRIVYLDGAQQFDLTNADLADGTFGLWTYFDSIQYDNLKILPYVATEPTTSVGSEVLIYPNDDPTIVPVTPITFNSISSFTETATKNDGEIKYQISNDGGTTWYWYNSGWTTTVTGYAEANTATVINSNIGSFPEGDGSFLFRAYLHSDGTDLVTLDAVDLTYVLDVTAPTGGSISYADGYTTQASIVLTVADGSDDSGINTATRTVQRKSATLSNGTCGSYGEFSTVTPSGTYPSLTDSSISSGYCYQYKYLVSDTIGNQATYNSSNTVKVDTGDPGVPGTPSTTTPTDTATQAWTWTGVTDPISGVANYFWRTTGSSILSGSTTLASLTTSFTDGIYNLFIRATDNAGNEGSESAAGSLTVDTLAPTISSVSSGTSSVDAATIQWTTNENSSSLVEYGISGSYGQSTAEADTTTRVTDHSVNLASLVSCNTYHYRVKSKDALAHEGVSSDYTFSTTGCLGSATIDSQSSELITTASGGTASLTSGSTGVSLEIPAGFDSSDAYFQIGKLNSSMALGSAAAPSGFQAINSYIYDLKALTNISTLVSSFDHNIKITITYSASDVAGIDESSLRIYTWTGSAWEVLSNCSVNTSAKTVACYTSHFSVFGLFGEETETTQQTTTTSTVSSSSTNPSVCTDTQPGAKVPWLYGAVAQSPSSVLLYFTEADDPVDKYVLEYGTEPGVYQYSSQNLGVNLRGQMTYLVESLSPNTAYYFRVRAGNGCASGGWSNEIQTKTLGFFTTNNLDLTDSSLETIPGDPSDLSDQTTEEIQGYVLSIKVKDEKGIPVKGAKVTIHSEVQTAVTDENGVAQFENVEAGNHEVTIAYVGYEGKENIDLTADSATKEFSLNVVIQRKEVMFPPWSTLTICVLVIALLAVIFMKAKHR